MADNVAITAGSGTTIATDDVGGVHYQLIKIMIGPADSVTALSGGSGATDAGTVRIVPASDSGLATAANQTTMIGHLDGVEGSLTTIIGHVDGIEGLLTTIDADTGAMVTALQLIDNAISGNEMQVDVVAALPAGSNTIGAVTNTHLTNALIGEYETVAASQTDQVIGATGASGDYLSHLIVVPATTSPGAVQIKDGSAGSNITVFTGGASSVSNLVPFVIPVGMTSAASGGWRVTTAGNVSVIAVGNFT